MPKPTSSSVGSCEPGQCHGVHAFDCDGTETGHMVQIQACDAAGRFLGEGGDVLAQNSLIFAAERGEAWALRELEIFLEIARIRYPEYDKVSRLKKGKP